MMDYLWPYYSTKDKAFFSDGEREVVFRRGEFRYNKDGDIELDVYWKGDRMPDKILAWNIFETAHLSSIKFIKE